jgi:heme exporter protein C
MKMRLDKKWELIILLLAIIFVFIAIYFTLLYTELVPTDVTPVVRNDSRYDGIELRIKGIVDTWDGNDTFILKDVKNPTFKLNVTHTEAFPSAFTEGETVYVTGVFSSEPYHLVESSDIEIADEPDKTAGWVSPYGQKIFYLHVSAAWVSFLAFGVVFIASILFLKGPQRKWDTIALSSAEVGVAFCTVAIITGVIWGKAEWGTYWRWDDTKLTITFVLWLIFIAYLLLRGGVETEDTSRLVAVFGIIGFVCVPLSFISSRIWQSMHPNVMATSEESMSADTGMGLLFGVLAFTFLYIFMLLKRIRIQKMSHRIEELKDKIGGI